MNKPTPKYVDKRSDEEWLANYYSRNPIFTKEIYVRAILMAVEAEASLIGVDVDLSDEIVSSALDSGDAGIAIGVGNESTRKETTLKLYNNGNRNGSVKRDGRQVDSFSYTSFGASFKWFKESEDPIPLNIQSYMREAAEELGLVSKGGKAPDPSVMKQRMEEQMEKDKIQAGFTAQSNELITDLNKYAEALFQFEYLGIKGLNEATGTTPSQMPYPKAKHTGFTPSQLDKAYDGAVLAPNGFNFLNTGDIMEDPRLEAVKGNRLEVAQVKVDVLRENLETFAAHLKVADELHSFEDEPHPLIGEYEEKYGTIRELTDKENKRTAIFSLSSKALNALINDDTQDIYGKDMVVPAINVSDLGNPDASIVSGQMFSGKLKMTPKYMSITEKVKVVGGDHTQPIDAIFLAEGVATAATAEEMVRFSPEYEGKNALVLSAFDVGNFKKVGVALHHQFPDIPLVAIADNDVKIRVDTGNRPIVAKDGGYSYITRDKMTISASEMPISLKDQKEVLAKNVGADSARFLNEYFLTHPNRDAEGAVIEPKGIAFVANKGQGLTDYLIIPASADKTGDTPITERLLSPKQDLNDVVQNEKRVIREDLKRFFASAGDEITPEQKIAKSKDVMQNLATVLIDNPVKALKPIMDKYFQHRLERGDYAVEQARPDIAYDNENDQNETYQKEVSREAGLEASQAVNGSQAKIGANTTNSGFSGNISNRSDVSSSKAYDKYEKSINNTADLAEKFTNSYVNNDILKAFNEPSPSKEVEPTQYIKPQDEPANISRPSPR